MKRIVVVLLLAACAVPKTAVVDGRVVPRQTLEFFGQPYSVTHDGAHPQPGSPSGGLRDAGGGIRGRACGLLLDFDVTHKGDHVQLVGSLDNHLPAAIDVSDDHGARHFTGNLGGLGVDFMLIGNAMQGHVGIRVFALEATDDRYAGFMRIPGLFDLSDVNQRVPARVDGRAALASMPAADQAAVLPVLMTCGGMQFHYTDGFVVGIGGTATDRPPETSAVYTNGK